MNANHEAWKARFARQCADIDKLEREIEALGRKLNAAATGTRSRAGVVPCPIPVAAAPDQPTKADAGRTKGGNAATRPDAASSGPHG